MTTAAATVYDQALRQRRPQRHDDHGRDEEDAAAGAARAMANRGQPVDEMRDVALAARRPRAPRGAPGGHSRRDKVSRDIGQVGHQRLAERVRRPAGTGGARQ